MISKSGEPKLLQDAADDKEPEKGVVPFIVLQLIGLVLVFVFPQLATWPPAVAYGK